MGADTRRRAMKYMVLMNYTRGVPPITEWAPEDVKASGAAMAAIHEELTARGELIGAEGLSGPEAAKMVAHDGVGAPGVTDGPFPESKEYPGGDSVVLRHGRDVPDPTADQVGAQPGSLLLDLVSGHPGRGCPGVQRGGVHRPGQRGLGCEPDV